MTNREEQLPLHVVEMGTGEDVFVLLHGFGGSSFTWRDWAPKLARLGRVLLVDMKGFGAAPKPDDGRYSPDDQAELVTRLVRGRDLNRITLVGHSFGGGVALLTALRLQADGDDRVRRMILVASAAYAQRLPPFVALAKWPRLSTALLRMIGVRRVIRGVLRSIVYERRSVSVEQISAYSEALEAPEGVRSALAAALQIVPSHLHERTARFPQLIIPTLVLWGDHDRVVPLSVGQKLAAELPNARLVVLERCGHIPPEEHPDASWQVVSDFLAERDVDDA